MNFVTKKHSQFSNTETKLETHEVARDAASTCSGSPRNFRDVGAGEEERIDFIASVWSQVISSQPGDNVQLIEFPKPKSAKLGSVPNVVDSPRNDGTIGLSGRFDRGSCDLSGLNADFDGVNFGYGNTMQEINVNANPAPLQNDSAGTKTNGCVNYSGESLTSVKKYGSLEHIKQLKRENTLKRNRLKSAKVRPAITDGKHAEQEMIQHNYSDLLGIKEPEADKDDALEDMCIPDNMKSLRRKISDEYNARIDPETGKDNADKTDENKTKELPSRADNEDRLYITPIKKYGSLEHMRNIKRDNAIHLKRLKSVTASSVITTPFNSFNYQNRVRSARKENASEIIPHNYVERYGVMSRGSTVGNETPRKAEHDQVAEETTEDQRSLASWTSPERKYRYESMEQTSKTTKSAQYGSKEHFEHVQKENVYIRNRKNSAKSKVDTWNLEKVDTVGQDRGRQTHAATTNTVVYGSLEETEKRNKIEITEANIPNAVETSNPGPLKTTTKTHLAETQQTSTRMVGPRKFGSVAHFRQARHEHISLTQSLRKVTSKLSTWQPREKMAALKPQRTGPQIAATAENMKSLKTSIQNAAPRIDDKRPSSGKYHVMLWSRHLQQQKRQRQTNNNCEATMATAGRQRIYTSRQQNTGLVHDASTETINGFQEMST